MEKIPHIVHYCWFGKKRKSPAVKKYIEEWRRKLPDYRFIEWNEENFQISLFPYAREAYEAKRYAFVSDVARIWALNVYGGVYLDTDIEVVKDFSDCLEWGNMVLAFETKDHLMTAFMASVPGHPLIGEMMEYYMENSFRKDKPLADQVNTALLTGLAVRHGLVRNGRLQEIRGGIQICPEDYFSAYRLKGEQRMCTENTYTVHHFSGTWQSPAVRFRKQCKQMIRSCFGQDMLDHMIAQRKKVPGER